MPNQPRFKHYTRGGQISFHNLRMWDQITKTLTLICLLLWVGLTAALAFAFTSAEKLTHAAAYYYAEFLNLVGQKHTFFLTFHGKEYSQSAAAILHYPYYAANAASVVNALGQVALISFIAAFIVGIGLAFYFIKRGKNQSESQFIRGSKFLASTELKKKIIQDKKASNIQIDGFPLIKDTEVQHLLVHGTVGSGKSQLIMKILDCLKSRGDRVIIYDKGCSFMPYYFNEEKDVLLNPFDERSANWNLWTEALSDADLENMAESLIPSVGESDPFWVNAARTVFVAAASKMRQDKERSLEKLLNILIHDEFSKLENYLKSTAAATLASSKIEKTAISIRSVLTTYLKSLQTLVGLEAENKSSFAIRDYLLNEESSGWLFISSNGEQHKTLKPLMSLWLVQASLTLLSLKPDRERRIWFICDELPTLHKLPFLGETIAEVRKFGGCFLLGMQSFSQLAKVYGQYGAKEIFDLLNTRFFFRSPSADMARLVSSELGEEEIEEARENYSYGANSIRDGISLGNQRVTRPIVAYPEVLELPDLECFLRLPGANPVTKLTLIKEERQEKSSGILPRVLSSAFNVDNGEEAPLPEEEASQESTALNTAPQTLKPKPKEHCIDYID